MNTPTNAHDHLLTAKQLISAFSRECDGEFSRFNQSSPSGRDGYGISDVVQIERFINQASELLSSLKTLRNSLVPVNRIPPEILTSIISYQIGSPTDLGRYQALTASAAACRYWRNAIYSFPSFWTTVSDVYCPQLRRTIFQRSMAAPLHVFCLRPTNDGFMEDFGAHTHRIKTLHCRITFGGGRDEPLDDAGNPNQMVSDFRTSSDALEALLLYRSVIRDIPETLKFGIVPDNPKALRTLELRKVPLTIQLTRLTTVTNFVYSHPHVRSEPLLDFFAANASLENVTVQCINISGQPNRPLVPLQRVRQLSFNIGHTVRNLLEHLQLPSTSRIDLFMNSFAEGKLLCELLPPSLHDLPGIANTTLLHCRFTSEFHLVLIGSNPDRGTFTVRGHPTQLFAGNPVDLRPLDLGAIRQLVLSSRTGSPVGMWSRLQQSIQKMTAVETLVVGGRMSLHDLPPILENEALFPKLSAITLVTPPLKEIPSLVSSILARINTPCSQRIEFLEVLCSPFDREYIVETVKRPLEGRVGLVEVKAIQDVQEVWVESIRRTIDREGFFK